MKRKILLFLGALLLVPNVASASSYYELQQKQEYIEKGISKEEDYKNKNIKVVENKKDNGDLSFVSELENVKIVENTIDRDGNQVIVLEPTGIPLPIITDDGKFLMPYSTRDLVSRDGKVSFNFSVPSGRKAEVYIENRTTVPFWVDIDLTNAFGFKVRNVFRKLFTEWGTQYIDLNEHGGYTGHYRFRAENIAGYNFTVRVILSGANE